MDTSRINQIYEELSTIHFQVAEDPRTQGTGYIARSIKQILDAIEKANALAVEIGRAFAAAQEELSLLKLEWEVSVRDTLLSRRIQDLEGVSLEEKRARARQLVNEQFKIRQREAYQGPVEEMPDFPSLEMKIVLVENKVNELKTLHDAVKEKVTSLRRTDSAVRLQNASLETEAKLFGAIPNGNGENGHSVARRPRRRQPQEVEADQSWNELTGRPDQPEQAEELAE